jgi:radical SAM superfamily enzyme YgiQ (UPF0313 family)
MKILLVSLPGIDENDGNLFPLGIGYLVGALRRFHEVQACHYAKHFDAEKEIKEKTKSWHPDIVGLSCTTFNRGYVRRLIKIIRSINKNLLIVVGGVHASYCYEQVLTHYGADVVVLGEGERTIKELCNALQNKLPLNSIKGIAYTFKGKVVANAPQEVVKNLDELDMPDYSYAKEFIEKTQMAFMISSRGCPVRCTFCSTSSYWGQKVRMNSPKRVVDEMEMLMNQFGVKRVFFDDDTFNLGIPRVIAICNDILSRKLQVEWACSCRVIPASEEMIAMMVKAGCRHICWGVESGSPDMLRSMNKKITLEQIRHAFELSTKYSHIMSTAAFTMVGNPGESYETVKKTTEFLNSIPLTDKSYTSILYILPGTVLYEDLKERKAIKERDWVRYDTVPLYTMENSYRTLFRWAKMISESGNRIPFESTKHFWAHTNILDPSHHERRTIATTLLGYSKRLLRPRSIIKKYLPAGSIRF